MALTFFSLNIEADLHLENVSSYLSTKNPDVIFLQEVYRLHAESWAKQFNYHLTFAPHVDFNIAEHIFKPIGEWGIATLTKDKPFKTTIEYYSEPPVIIPHEFMKALKHPRSLITTTLEHEGQNYVFANTHFTWALPDAADLAQWPDYLRLQALLDKLPSFILAGDLNATRDSQVYRELASRYVDHLPKDLESTLDPVLFRKPELKLVVDHLFSTPDYRLSNVEVLTGLSDHCGLSATISR